jgi:hypothetical protein
MNEIGKVGKPIGNSNRSRAVKPLIKKGDKYFEQ